MDKLGGKLGGKWKNWCKVLLKNVVEKLGRSWVGKLGGKNW